MKPLQIFLSLRQWLATAETLAEMQSDDPFRHADIRAMSQRQLADLPLPGHFREKAAENPPLARCA